MFKVNIKFCLFLVLTFLYAHFEGGRLPYRIFYAFAAVLLLSIIIIIINLKSFKIRIKFNKNVYGAGDSDRFTLRVINNGIVPIAYANIKNSAFQGINPKYNGDIVYLSIKNTKSINYDITFRTRGSYDFGENKVNFMDIACLFQKNKIFKEQAAIKVYPKVSPISSNCLRSLDVFENLRNNKTGVEDLYTIRDNRKYRDGDNLKKINWKLSARHNELYVKNNSTISGEEFSLFFDMSKNNYKYDRDGIAEEQLVDMCASFVNLLTKRKLNAKLYINASISQKFNIDDNREFEKIMDYFLETKSDSDTNFVTFLKSKENEVYYSSGIVLITARINKELTDYVMKLANQNKKIIIFYSQQEKEDVELIERLKKLEINAMLVSQVLD